MSVSKVGAVKSSSSAIDYVLKEQKQEKKPKIIGGNILGFNKQEIKNEFRAQEVFNPKTQNTVTHISVSFPQGRQISDETAADYADKLVEKLGYEDTPFLVVRHFDKDERQENSYAHIHIVASRIKNDGSLISEWKSAEKVIAATKETDLEMELESAEYVKNERERNIKKDEYRIMQKSEKLSVMEEFKDAAEQSLHEIKSLVLLENSADAPRKLEYFVNNIQKSGFEVLPNIDEETRQVRGFSFKKDKLIFTASKAGKQFAWQNLKEKVEYQTEKDYRFLVDLKAYVLANSGKKVGTIEKNLDQNSVNTSKNLTENITLQAKKDTTKHPDSVQNLAETTAEIRIGSVEKHTNFTNPGIIQTTEITTENNFIEIKTNEKTFNTTTEQPKTKTVDRRILFGIRGDERQKEKNDTQKTLASMEKQISVESGSSLVETKLERGKSAEIRDGRNDHAQVESGKIVGGNAAKATKFADSSDAKVRVDEHRDEQKTDSIGVDYSVEGAAIERLGYDDSESSSTFKSPKNGDKKDTIEHGEGRKGIREISDGHQQTEGEFFEGIVTGGNYVARVSNEGKFPTRSGELEYERTSLTNEQSDRELKQTSSIVSKTNRDGERFGQETREKNGKLGSQNAENFEQFNICDDLINIDDVRLLDDISKSKQDRLFNDSEGKSGEKVQLFSQFVSTCTPRNEEFLPIELRYPNQAALRVREQIRSKAAAVAQVINVKFFSALLDEQIVTEWSELISNSDSEEFLSEIVKPKTETENEILLTNMSTQAKIIAESLSLPEPIIIKQCDPDRLQLALTKIEITNYEVETGEKVSEKVFEELWNQKFVEPSNPLTERQTNILKQEFKGVSDYPIFNSQLETEVFCALIYPDEIKFNETQIQETQAFVLIEERAAVEMTTLVQIAYGGQQSVFTDKFKSILAEEVYYENDGASNLYSQYKDFDWQNIIERFAPVVDNLAEINAIIMQPPADDKSRNYLLADYYTEQLTNISGENNSSSDRLLTPVIFDFMQKLGSLSVHENQIKTIAHITNNNLESPKFGNALEADVYIFEKLGDDSRTERAEQTIDFIVTTNQSKPEKQIEIENRQSRSNELEM